MAEVERIWRIITAAQGAIEVRLAQTSRGDQQVILQRLGANGDDPGAFDVDVARAVAQAMLEACEVASALDGQLEVVS